MKSFSFTDCELVLLLDLISQILSSTDINPVTGKRELPYFRSIDLRELDKNVLRSILDKLSNYLE